MKLCFFITVAFMLLLTSCSPSPTASTPSPTPVEDDSIKVNELIIADLIPEANYLLKTKSRAKIIGNIDKDTGAWLNDSNGAAYVFELLLNIPGAGAITLTTKGVEPDTIPMKIEVKDNKVVMKKDSPTLLPLSWVNGAEHIYMKDTQVFDYTFESDPAYPLVFRILKQDPKMGVSDTGYIYLCGRGKIKKNSGKSFRIGDDHNVAYWLPKIKSGSEFERQAAAQALGWLGDSSIESALIQASEDMSWEVRRNAVEALGRIPLTQQTRTSLINLCHKKSDLIDLALESLSRHGQEAMPVLATMLEEKKLKKQVILALSINGSAQALETLIACLSEKKGSSTEIRTAAATALGNYKTVESTRALIAALSEKKKEIREAAVQSLLQMDNDEAYVALRKVSEEDPDPEIRKKVNEILNKMERHGE